MLLLLVVACGGKDAEPVETGGRDPAASPRAVPLRWIRGYEGDSWEQARVGITWQLAALGAVPPPGDPAIAVTSRSDDEVRFTLDLDAVGFPEAALPAVDAAIGFVAGTDEVALAGGLDVGAFFLRTLYEPWHYYAITGACADDASWAAARLPPDPLAYAITESLLVEGDRLDRYVGAPATVAGIAHLVEEGPGSIAEGTFEPLETESIDVLPNGMLRYAVYDGDGALAPWGLASPAGQPGKCAWCHEDHLQRGTDTNPGAEGYVDVGTFQAQVDAQTAIVAALRAQLDTAVYADPVRAHEDGELLTETWLLPSPGRLAREWHVDPEVLGAALVAAGVPFQSNPEYPAFGDLVSRGDADAIFADLLPALVADPAHPFYGGSPDWTPLETLPSAREPADVPLVWGDAAALRCE